MSMGIFYYVLQYMSLVVAIEMRKLTKEELEEEVVVLIATLFLIVVEEEMLAITPIAHYK